MDWEIFVTETTIYEIYCSNCTARTDEHQSADEAISDATELGFEIEGDQIVCYACAG